MYIRAVHAEANHAILRRLICENPLGMLTTGIRSATYPFLQTSHIPFVLDEPAESGTADLGRLRGHLARQNPQSKAMVEALAAAPNHVLEDEVLVIFTGPDHYVSPQFYTETKPATGKVVPTWNYAAAQVYGRARIYHDAGADETGAFLQRQMEDLTHHQETATMGYTGTDGRPGAWKVADAPDRYVELLKKAVVGIEITIDRIEGKFKMSQEMGKGDRAGVADGLAKVGSDAAQWVAKTVQQRSDEKEAQARP